MKNKVKSSRLQLFILISFVVHLALFYLLPYTIPVTEGREIPKPEEKLQKVEFIRLGQEGEVKSPTDKNGVPESGKDKALQVAQSPDVTEPTDNPKPAADPKAEPAKNAATIVEPDTVPTPKTPVTQPPKSQLKPHQETTGVPAVKPGANSDATKVVTSKNSDKAIDIPTEPTGGGKPVTREEKPAKNSEAGQPAPGPVAVEEKKPNLPTNPGDALDKMVTPVYPKNADNENVEGIVNLLVAVESSGKIKDVKVIHSSGDKRLDDVSVNTVKRGWSFKEMPQPYTVTLKVTFKSSDVAVTLDDIKFSE